MGLPKKMGGFNLPSLKDVFSQSKAVFFVRYNSPLHKEALWREPFQSNTLQNVRGRKCRYPSPLLLSPHLFPSKNTILKWCRTLQSLTLSLFKKVPTFTWPNPTNKKIQPDKDEVEEEKNKKNKTKLSKLSLSFCSTNK